MMQLFLLLCINYKVSEIKRRKILFKHKYYFEIMFATNIKEYCIP